MSGVGGIPTVHGRGGSQAARWLESDPRAAIAAAAEAAMRLIPGHLGVCVACVLEDRGADREPDLNIWELAHTLLTADIPVR